jgi:hypothetical protein
MGRCVPYHPLAKVALNLRYARREVIEIDGKAIPSRSPTGAIIALFCDVVKHYFNKYFNKFSLHKKKTSNLTRVLKMYRLRSS